MKRLLTITGLTIFLVNTLVAQDQEIQNTIDEQVWRPFVDSWSGCNASAFKQLHTDDVLRVSGGWIHVGDQYKANIDRSFEKCVSKNIKRTIEFTFVERTHQKKIGYEVGYYKITSRMGDGEPRNSYGRFHVVLKNVDGVWKVAQDWDTGSIRGTEINEEDFKSGSPWASSK